MSSSLAAVEPSRQPVASRITSFDGTVIHYDVWDAPSRSLVLVVPGFWRERRSPSMLRLGNALVAQGYRTAIVDARGHGESGGTYGFNVSEHFDIDIVARRLLADLPIDSITMLGFSYGGAIAISTAARHELPIRSLLLISPVADFSMIVPRINPFTIYRHIAMRNALHAPRFVWRNREKIRAVDDISKLHVPVSFIHVKNDWLINHRHSLALYEHANEPKELHILDIEGNYHADRIFAAASESIEPLVREFLARYTTR
ncbi:MAG TPA: alpha/beta fold hydrolase [Thermoanaerobaculia bacterium]|nr:alpha/beta fold hydrolase [Thermoanaerobaculia bacterium]